MREDDERTERTGDTASGGTSRRRFLRAGAAVGAAGLGLGASGLGAAERVTEKCDTGGGTIDVGETWTLMDNQWSLEPARQCIWERADGGFGYEFDATGIARSGPDEPPKINYPEVFCGARPWGRHSGADEFPIRRGDVDELVLEVDADLSVSGGEWDWAEEWWLLDGEPGSSPPITHEIMLLLDWGGGHSHGSAERDVWTDRFGNTVDYWAESITGGTDADFHVFRVSGGMSAGTVDLAEVIEFMTERHGVREDLLLTGIELGNEYWPGAQGEVTYRQCDLTVNGTTYESEVDGGSDGGESGAGAAPDATAPTPPSNVRVPAATESSIEAVWNAATDDGTGVERYVVRAGGEETTVPAGRTRATVDGLAAGRSYRVSVRAVDGAGNESPAARTGAATDGDEADESTVAVELASDGVDRSGETTATVVLSEAPAGVSGTALDVRVSDPSVAAVASIDPAGGLDAVDGDGEVGGASASIETADLTRAVQAGAQDVPLATVTLAGRSAGETDVSVAVRGLDDDEGDEMAVATTDATLSVASTVARIDGTVPGDVDGDGHYEDLNGSGEVDYDDVVTYFRHMEEPTMTDHAAAYDYNDNGRVDYGDLIDLFEDVD